MSENINKVAVVSPGILPVPAVQGGAVEVLTTLLLEGMSRDPHIEFELYTIPDDRIDSSLYKNGNIIFVSVRYIDKLLSKAGNLLSKAFGRSWRFRPYHFALMRKMKRKKYSYVLIENNMELYHIVHHFSCNKNNLIFHLHNDLDSYSKSPEKCKLITDTARSFLVVSEYLKNRVLSVNSKAEIKVLLNSVNVKMFRHNELDRDELRNQYKVEQDTKVIMYSGRIDPTKGVYELAQAFVKIKNRGYNCCLVIVGASWFDQTEGDEYSRRIVNVLSDCHDVICTGFIPPNKVPRYLSMADIVVIPSKWEEAFGLVALEAMSASKCIIATKTGGMKEVLDENCAIMIDNGDNLSDALFEAIEQLMLETDKIKTFSEKAYAKVSSHKEYNDEYYYANYRNIIEVKEGD